MKKPLLIILLAAFVTGAPAPARAAAGDIPAPPSSEIVGVLWVLAGILGVGGTAVAIASGIKSLKAGPPKDIPQPLETRRAANYVERTSYETHSKINRDEHLRIEHGLREELNGLRDRHNSLSGDVREMMGVLESNGVRLLQMDQKIDRLLERRNPIL